MSWVEINQAAATFFGVLFTRIKPKGYKLHGQFYYNGFFLATFDCSGFY